MHSPDRLRTLLRELDDPDRLELPAGHDLSAARHRFARLAGALEDRFGPSVTSGVVQDASFHGYVSTPDRWVLLSNFGPFVTTGTGPDWGVPGCEEGLDPGFVTWLDGLCASLGCVYVPVALLLEPYDGPSPLADEPIPGEEDEDDDAPPLWWDRYFQYM
ncbi:hypothetical protein IAG44_03255 [Streptomyces roseirectus]|uniref:Uncharacterized protein n=1 Tax=Streptomyces roseirectus TaxID=2768066 RepID=A0A7H0I719_9ACTN|nr:hypothetical protein [Streptomyces roseirectus]QNP68585.1 hypothetical protein IAG44_03255 [Streptomyces roseirectus]